MTKRTGPILVALLLGAVPVSAQPGRPGSLGEEQVSARDQVMRSYQNARWKLGPMQVEPQLSIANVSYVSNVFFSVEGESVSDLRATPSAGLRGFLNLGPKVVLSPFVSASYAWWLEQKELRSLNESFGLQLFGDFNRLQLQFQAGRVGSQRNLSSELEVPVDLQDDRIGFDFDIEFWRPFRLFALAAQNRRRYDGKAAEEQVAGLDVATLESDTDRLRGGIAYGRGDGLFVALGIEQIDVEYLLDPRGRSYRGEGPLFRLGYDGTRLTFDLDVAFLDIDFVGREGFDRRQETGFAQLGLRFSEKLTGRLYGSAELTASALDAAAIFDGRRTGVSLQHDTSRRARLLVFYEVGEDEFATAATDDPTRVDDHTGYGVSLRYQVHPRLLVQVGYSDINRDSTDPLFDRQSRSISTRISIGGDLLPW